MLKLYSDVLANKIDGSLQLQWAGKFSAIGLKNFQTGKFNAKQHNDMLSLDIDPIEFLRYMPTRTRTKIIHEYDWDSFFKDYDGGYYQSIYTTFGFFRRYTNDIQSILKYFDGRVYAGIVLASAKRNNVDLPRLLRKYELEIAEHFQTV